MTTENQVQRVGVGRRKDDENCKDHEKRLDDMERKESKRSGWFTAMASVVSVVLVIGVPCVAFIGNVLVGKVSSIESKLSTGNETLIKHTEQLASLDKRVIVIEKQHDLDQEYSFKGKK